MQEELEEKNSLSYCFTRTRVKILTQKALVGRVLGRTREELEEKNALLHKELEQESKQTQQLAQQVCLLYWYKRTNTDAQGAGAGEQAERASVTAGSSADSRARAL